jgi:tetratricopeptide (TPR) repeat protein
MARRRLNKKVALLGSAVFLLLALAAVAVISRLNRSPAPYLADGDAAWAAGDYEAACENYKKAYGLTPPQDAEGKVALAFKLVEVYQRLEQWPNVLQCWEAIITTDPQNMKARLAKLKYSYVLADSLGAAGRGANQSWGDVHTQAEETIKMAEEAGCLNDPESRWESSCGPAADRRWGSGNRSVGARLHFVKGRAALELARVGAVTSPGASLQEAETDLQEARSLDPNNAQAYHFLAQVFLERGDIGASRGSVDQKDAAEKQADAILAEGVRVAGGGPEAHIYLLTRKTSVAQRGGITAAREQMKVLEPQYEALVQRFASSPRAWAAQARFYSFCAAYLDSKTALEKLDKAIGAMERACALEGSNVEYLTLAASYQYRRFSIYRDIPALQKAVELAETALRLPDANDAPGPLQYAGWIHKYSLSSLLAKCCIERVLMLPPTDPARAGFLRRAEKAVHDIEQIQGSGENPEVLKWKGMLDLAHGQTGNAVRNLYAAYEQVKAGNAADEQDAFLSYMLARIFARTPELGAAVEFLGSALNSGIIMTKPEALLDYGDILFQAGSYDAALNAVNSFVERFGDNPRSRVLRIKVLVAGGHVTEAEEAIARLRPDDPNAVALDLALLRTQAEQLVTAMRREVPVGNAPLAFQPVGAGRSEDTDRAMLAELRENLRRQAGLMERVLQADPNAVGEKEVISLCQALVAQRDVDVAQGVVAAFLKRSPDSVAVLFYRGLLAEPDPAHCPEARRREIQEQAIKGIGDPVRRALELGSYYRQTQQWDEAVVQWQSVLEATAAPGAAETPAYLQARPLSPRPAAAGLLFDLACARKNWELATQVVDMARRDNLDDCGGRLFAARLADVRGDPAGALNYLEECLRERPLFSYGYMLRGNVKAELGREQESVADIQRAATLSPLDPMVAKALANAFSARHRKLGNKLSSEQQAETKEALERAILLDPRDTNVLAVYADFMAQTEPLKALALRQTLQNNAPSVANAVALGKLAAQMALKETDETRRKALFTVAETAFEQARQIEPSNQYALESYAEYFRAREQNDKARQLLVDSNDSQLLWRHYFRVGRLNEAKKLLEKMYAEDQNKIDALKGLVLVAEGASDKEAVQKYSEELLGLEDNVVNRLAQLRAYLDMGLVQEAGAKLQSFRAKYPNEPRAVLMEALVARRQGQLPRALELVNRYLAGEPQDASAWRLHGEISFLTGDAEHAILDFRKSRTLEDDPVTTVNLAKACLTTGRNDEAVDELRRLLGRSDAPLEARTLLESTYHRLGRTEALQQLYASTLAEFPDNVFWLNRAGAFAVEQKQYGRAEELYHKAYQLKQQAAANISAAEAVRDAQYGASLDGYLQALILAAGDSATGGGTWHPEKLDIVFQEAGKYVATSYAAVAFFRMAEAKKKLGDAAAVRDYCRQAVDKAWANDRLAVEMLMRVYLLVGADEVSQYCRQRLDRDPRSLAANFTLFSLASIQDKYDEAVGYVDTCIRLCGADANSVLDYTIKKGQLLTSAYGKTSDKRYLQQAIRVYQSLRAKMPKNRSVLNNLAYTLAQNDEQLTEALEYAKAALEQSPNEANFLDTYAYVLYKNGRNTEAAQSLAVAIQRCEATGAAAPDIYEHMGLVHEALGEKSKAQAAYRRALEVGGNALPAVVKERLHAALARLTPQE